MDQGDYERYVDGLAWDCVAAGQRPPLQPTTCAIIRLLAVRGCCRFGVLAQVVPCSVETIRQQLSRLVRSGVVVKAGQRGAAGRVIKVYRLSLGGMRMVLQWRQEHAKMVQRIKRLTIVD